jgi:hypothetical protein
MAIEGVEIDSLQVPQPGQRMWSDGVTASSAARIVGDHSMSRPRTSCSLERWMTTSGLGARGFASAVPPGAGLDVELTRPHPHGDPHLLL